MRHLRWSLFLLPYLAGLVDLRAQDPSDDDPTPVDGRIRGVLRDRRIKDPAGCFVSLDQAGYGGSGAGKAVYASVLLVMDFAGRQVFDYAVDDGRNSNGEQQVGCLRPGKRPAYFPVVSSSSRRCLGSQA
jgi:hypothetical protein